MVLGSAGRDHSKKKKKKKGVLAFLAKFFG